MKTVDYDQVARFEAASELLNVLMGMCISLKETNIEYADKLEDKRYEIRRIKQTLKTRDDRMVKKVRDIYGSIAREYYASPKDFKLTKSFFEAKVILQAEAPRSGTFTLQKMLENMTPAERKEWEGNLERELEEAKKNPQPKGYDEPTFI